MEISSVLTTILKYAYNVSFDDFKIDFAKVINGYVSDGYGLEKFNSMRQNFVSFYCNLDDEAKEKFIEVALAHYSK